MSDTFWEKLVSGKELNSLKITRNRTFISKKELSSNLPSLVDDGWEMAKEYKNPKYILVRKDKTEAELFEDKLWLLFARMEFTELHADNTLFVPYDHHDRSKTRQIDVLAADNETVIAINCRASEYITEGDFTDYLLGFKDQMGGVRREIVKQFPNHKVKFIFATHNYTLTHKDMEIMEMAGIMHFNDSIVDYYVDLVKHLGSSARYQLLGNLFANQEIRNMENRIPAIRGKMGGYTYYSFSIEPEKLLKIGYVLHRNEANQNMMPTYQRLIKKSRLQSVRKFVNEGGYFPNSVIISIDSGGRGLVFDQSATKIEGPHSKIGVLQLPKRYRSAYIIDGQHRVYGYSDSDYANSHTIPVVAFVDLDRTEQIKIFMDINENQKAVPKTLRVTLSADMLWDSPDLAQQREALRSKIAQMLGEEVSSPLYMRVVIGENDTSSFRCITVSALQSALGKTRFFTTYGKKNAIVSEGSFDCGTNQETCDLFYPFLELCLLYMRDSCPDEWNRGDEELGILTVNRGIQAVIRVLDDIVNLLIDKEVIFPKTQTIDDMFDIIKYYLKPLTEYLNTISQEDRKRMRGIFGGGADTHFWRTYQKAIADARPDFKPDGLDLFWLDSGKTFNEDTKALIPEIENKLKAIISSKLEETLGSEWLIKGLPKTVYYNAKKVADGQIYENIRNDRDSNDISPWDFVSIKDCKEIVLNGRNWSTLFSEILVRPEDMKLSGGKDAKTEWMPRLGTIQNKLGNESYSVPSAEYDFVKSVHEWLMSVLVF